MAYLISWSKSIFHSSKHTMGRVLLALSINVSNKHRENAVTSKKSTVGAKNCKVLQAKLPDFNLKDTVKWILKRGKETQKKHAH